MRVAIFGAGAIGGYLGTVWSAADVQIDLIGRKAVLERLRATGGGLHETPEALRMADLVLVTLKSTSLDGALPDLAQHVPEGTPIAVLMNGLAPARRVAEALPEHDVLAAMVPFNVVWAGDDLHRSSAGEIMIAPHEVIDTLAGRVAQTYAPLLPSANIEAVLYGKLLLNLINPINALSGLTLKDMLAQRDYRSIYADVLAEALAVYDAANVRWQKVGPFSPRIASKLLRLPDTVFNAIILKIQKIDAGSRASMAADVRAGKPTEVHDLNGEIVRLAKLACVAAPLNAALVRLVEEAQPNVQMSAEELRDRL